MTLQQLRYFVTAADTLSFAEAAKQLFIAPSAISYGISNLESDLNVQLFYRRRNSLELTSEGRYLYQESSRILSQISNIYQTLGKDSFNDQNELRIGFLASLLKPYFSDLILPFINSHSEIRLSMQPMNLDPMMNAVKNDELDLILTRSFQISYISGKFYDSKKICSDNMALLVYEGHPAAKLDSIDDMAFLSDEPFIAVDPKVSQALNETILRIAGRRNCNPVIKYSVPNMDNVFTQVASHMGISIVPYFKSFYASTPGLRFVPINGDDTKADVVAVWKKERKSRLVSMFLDSMIDPDRTA